MPISSSLKTVLGSAIRYLRDERNRVVRENHIQTWGGGSTLAETWGHEET